MLLTNEPASAVRWVPFGLYSNDDNGQVAESVAVARAGGKGGKFKGCCNNFIQCNAKLVLPVSMQAVKFCKVCCV